VLVMALGGRYFKLRLGEPTVSGCRTPS
jgi:hypothetical protein